MVTRLRPLCGKLYDLAGSMADKGIDLSDGASCGRLMNFNDQKRKYYVTQARTTLKQLCDLLRQMGDQGYNVQEALSLVDEIGSCCADELLKKAARLREIAESVGGGNGSIRIPSGLPAELREEMVADIHEVDRCFRAGCYRSVVILCGRLMETALHRRYYDATGQDVLEKNPGIGLGKLIAKMKEKDVALEPGLSEQIHLINQMRIFSVHKKKDAFVPSREQVQAIMLYTVDVIGRMFE